MVKTSSHGEKTLDARALQVKFSPAVQDAFRSIAVAARKSEQFDAGIYGIVRDWSGNTSTSVHDVMISLPSIAQEVSAHIRTTNDQAMKDAWEELCTQMPENGFAISQSLQRRR